MAINRKITMTYGKESITLDVNPKSLSVEYPQLNKKSDLISGSFIRMGGNGLASMKLTTFLPAVGSAFNASGKSPEAVWNTLYAWKMKKRAVSVRIDDIGAMSCFITLMTKTLQEGDGDPEITVALSEQKAIDTQGAEARKPAANAKQESSGEKKEKRQYYTVKKGDSLFKIAKRYYGAGAKWQTIYKANKGVIGCNPNLILPGQKLILP